MLKPPVVIVTPSEGSIYANLPAYPEQLVEITDEHDRPLLLMGERDADAQRLPYRRVCVILRERGGRLWFARRAHEPDGPRLWDFSARGAVRAGEAQESAAARLLFEHLGISGVQLVPRAGLPPSDSKDAKQTTLFTAEYRGAQSLPLSEDGMFLDKDEMFGLAEHFPDLFDPCLLNCILGDCPESMRK